MSTSIIFESDKDPLNLDFPQPQPLTEATNSSEVSTWFKLPEYLSKVLQNTALLTSNNSNRDQNTGLNDPRGNHICFSTLALHPAEFIQKLNFGLIFNRNKLEQYCESKKDDSSFGIKRIASESAADEIDTPYLTRHKDFEKNLSIITENQGGVYIAWAAETKSGTRIVKLTGWEKPIQLHTDNEIEVAIWDAICEAFKELREHHSDLSNPRIPRPFLFDLQEPNLLDTSRLQKKIKKDSDAATETDINGGSEIEDSDLLSESKNDYIYVDVDEDISAEDIVKSSLDSKYSRVYSVRPISDIPQFKCLEFYDYVGANGAKLLRKQCIQLLISPEDPDVIQFYYEGQKLLNASIKGDAKMHLIDNLMQEEEFRLYFEDNITEFKFKPDLINAIYLPSVYYILDSKLNPSNTRVVFLDVEKLYTDFLLGRVSIGGSKEDPQIIFKSTNDKISHITLERAFRTAYKDLDITSSGFIAAKSAFRGLGPWVATAFRYGFFKALTIKNQLTSGKVDDLKNSLKLVHKSAEAFIELFKQIKASGNKPVKFYLRYIPDGAVSPIAEEDLEATERVAKIEMLGDQKKQQYSIRKIGNMKRTAQDSEYHIKNRQVQIEEFDFDFDEYSED